MNRHRLLILFVLATVVASLSGLREARMQSSTLRRITNTSEEGFNLNPSISGDGRIIGFESTEDVAAAGGTDHFRAIRANITGDPATFFQIAGSRLVAPAISQDGSRIAFASRDDLLGFNSDGNSEIFLFDGAKLIQATNTTPGSLANRITNGNFQPSISDDGRFIAFSSNRDLAGQNGDVNLEIFIYDSAANSFAQLTNSSGIVGATDAKISGDGTTVAFIRDNGASPSTARDLMKQPRAGGSATMLASSVPSPAMTYGRAISDDGARVVYSSETATNTTQVFMFDGRSGGTIRQITSLGARVTEVPLDPTISGDGSRIAFAARRTVSGAGSNSDGGVELYVYDFPTLTFSKLTNAPSSATAEIVSSLNDDGSIVAFNFPRVLSGAVTNSGTENNSEVYAIAPPARPLNGTLTAILNDASLGHEQSASKAVAPNSIAAAQGTNLANTTAQSQRLADGTLPTSVGGTRLTVNGRAAQIFFVSPTQINFLVPPQTEIGTAEVIVTSSENFPSRGTVPTLRAAPGIFTKTGDGIGEGTILNAETLQEGPFDPTGGNLRLSIFATGARNAATTTVSIGGRVVNAEAVLPSTTLPGLDEVHVRVPADLRGAGTVNLILNSDGRDSNPVTVSFIGDPGRAILFNEVLADPPNGIAGDANNDGVRDTTDDEFVELVNGSSAETIGMSGWTVKTRATGSTTETTRFAFPAGASLAPGAAAVIFGGGTFNPADPVFGCAQIFRATSASSGLSLTNTGLTILLRDSAGNLIAQFSYGSSTGLDGNNSQSLTRSPDITGSFVLHTTANSARRFSPGLKVDGTPFGACAGHPATVTISPTSTSVNQGQSTQFTAQTFDQFGRAMTGVPITFTSDNATVATIDSTSTNQSNGVVTANVGTYNPGVAHITASANDGTTTTNSAATLTVVGPALSVNDVSRNEGNAGSNTFTFTVSLSLPAPSGGVRFDIATQDGTGTVANNDYVARTLTNQVIPAGAQTYSFEVTVNGDTAIEPNENFFLSVSNVSGASITKGQGTGTIVNDDSPTLSVSDVSANEGDSGTTKFTFTVTTPVVAESGGLTFDIATADGTATAASGDYVARALTGQTIPAGQSNYTFDVTVNGDTLVELNETFFVNITNVSGASVNDDQGQATIQNDDTPNLVISQIYPGGGLSSATYTNDFIELYNRGTTTVDFSITPYSAQFLSITGSTWARTDLTTGVIPPGRYFLIREASGGSNGSALPTTDATGTINLTSTTDGKVALVFGTTLLAGSCPGDDGTQPFNPANVTDFAGYGGTAPTANHCYEGTGPSQFTLGNNTIADFRKAGGCVDTNDNASDFFTAQPSPRNSASPIGNCKPEITINNVAVTEGNSGTVNATFTVSLSATSAQIVKVDFATSDGTATTASDYQANNGTLTFNPGDLSKTITVLVNGDPLDEANETFFVSLSNPVNASIVDAQGLGTINDNDPQPSLAINDVSVAEGNSGTTAMTFTVTLSTASGQAVAVNYATADNTATAPSDYQSTSSTITFSPGETAKQLTVSVNGDPDFEQNETLFVNLSGATNATISDGQGTGTITNDDAAPATSTFFINDVSVGEGNSGTTTATFTVTLSPASNQQTTVDYATANSTAASSSDYQSTSGTLTFAIGETSKQVSVNINGDTLVEPDETFFVNLTSATGGAGIGDNQGVGTITNDDVAQVVISQIYGGGNNSGATYKNDYVELFNRGTTTVDLAGWSVQQASATGTSWSVAPLCPSGSCLITPGKYFLINEAPSNPTNGADLPGPDATGTANLGTASGKIALVSDSNGLSSSGCPFGPSIIDFAGYGTTDCSENSTHAPAHSNTTADFRRAGGCTDTNDNAADFFTSLPFPRNSSSSTNNCAGGATPNLSVNDVTVTEGNSGTTTATFTVSLSAPALGTDVTFDIATANGTATTANSDYAAKSSLNQIIPAGQTNYTFTVNVNGDPNVEPDETFLVNVTNVSGATVTDGQGQGTIQNDDLPSLSINDTSAFEGDAGTKTFTFTVSLSAPAPATVTFDIATADGVATTTDNDYMAQSLAGQTIAAGQQTYQFDVTVNGDTSIEPDETFVVNVTNVSGANIADGQGTGTIQNDDSPKLTIDDVSANEGDSGTTTFTLTVSLSQPAPAGGVMFDITTADGTATTAANDYSTHTLTNQSISAGQSSYTFEVTVNGDKLVESNETFLVNVTNVNGATVLDSQGQGTIQNDDTASLVVSQAYPGGGLSGATYKNDFIELFNRGTTTVDFSVANYSVQFLSVGGSTWAKTNLTSGTLAPGQYFLVQEAGGATGANLPAADATGSINLTSTTAGKVALVSSTTLLTGNCPGDDLAAPFNPTNVVDFVGYGGAAATTNHCYEGSGPSSFTLSNNTIADFRKLGGCQDTDDNAADFNTATPNPRNTSSPLNDCSSTDLAITKSDSPDPVINGQNVTYTIVVTNNGPAVAQSVVVTDNLPAEVTFVSCNSTGSGLCGGSGNNRTVTFSSLAVGAPETITLVATVNVAGGSSISNTASVTSSTTDSVSGNDSATATTVVINPAFADLSLAKTDSPDPVYPTQTLTYTITLTNHGPDAANSVVVTDALPSGVTMVDCSANQSGVCGGASTTPTVNFSSLANGATATITIHVTVNSNVTASTVLTNNASVTSTTADSNGGNNSASADTTVQELNAGDLLISEFRTRGPSGASDEFVEIYNPGTSTVVIGGLKIRASNSAATTSDRVTITAGTTLGAGCHYLIANSSAYSGSTAANQTYTTGITDDGGVAITRNNGTTIIDQAGMSAGSAYKEGTTLTPLIGTTNQSYERKPGGAAGNGTDTNNNSSNFSLNAGTSNPQNASSGCLDTTTADLSITNSDSPDPLTVNSDITYTITVTNNGIGTAGNVLVTDNLPSSLTYVSCNSTGGGVCGGAGSNRTVNFSSLSVGATATITIAGTVNGTGGASISNTASVSSATTDLNGTNDSATATTTVSSADLSITNSDSPDPVNAAENITYTLTVTNNSATIPAESVTVSDPLASNTTLVSVGATPAGWTRTDSTAIGATGTITYTRTTLAASAAATFTITATVDSGAANNSAISNRASVSSNTPDDTPANDSAAATTTVRTRADLSLSKAVNIATPNVGDQVIFTITVSNAGPNVATGVVVNDSLPAGLSFVSATPSQGTYNNTNGTWTVGTVSVGTDTASLSINATVDTSGTKTNAAEITASDVFDPDSTPNNHNAGEDDQASIAVTPKTADLSLTKTVDNASPIINQNVAFTVTVSNGGPNAATNVVVKDLLPAGLTFVSATPGQGSYNNSNGVWNVGTVNSSASATLQITATVTSSGTITNTAEVTASEVFDPDSTPNNHNAGEDDQASRAISSLQADLSLTKSVDNATPNVGSNVVFTIKLSNGGPDAATGVVVSDSLPAGLSFVSATPSQGTYNNSSGAWTVGTVSLGTDTATLSMTATATTAGTKTNTAEITAAAVFDPDSTPNNHNGTEDDQASVTVTPQQAADLSITKSDSPDPVAVGNDISYTITVTNAGPDAATSAAFSDTVPTNMTFRSISPPGGWTCGTTPAVGGTGAISCTNPSFAVGSGVFTLVVRVGSAVADNTTISNTASVSSNTFNPSIGSESATQTTTVRNPGVVISQIYGAGGNVGATYQNDFVELFNRTSGAVDISAWSIQYQAATTTGGVSGTAWSVAQICSSTASGTCLLPAHAYYLVKLSGSVANGIPLPTPDSTPSNAIIMAATAGKVALATNTTALISPNGSGCPSSFATVIDFVGYGATANCFEGAGPAAAPSTTNATFRVVSGCTDTNRNSADFAAAAVTPRNSSSTHSCP